jgi:hypothetical protein
MLRPYEIRHLTLTLYLRVNCPPGDISPVIGICQLVMVPSYPAGMLPASDAGVAPQVLPPSWE